MDDDNISLQIDNDMVTTEDVPDEPSTITIKPAETNTVPTVIPPNTQPKIVTVKDNNNKANQIPPTAPPKTLDVNIRALSDNILTTPDDPIIEIDTTKSWDNNKTEITKPGPAYKLSTDYYRKVKAASKIKNTYFKKKVGQRKQVNKISAEWL